MSRRLQLTFLIYSFLLCCYAVFSYSLTDPNLVLSGWAPYWSWQQWMWQNVWQNKQVLVSLFIGLISLLFICYGLILRQLKNANVSSRWFIVGLIGCILPLLFSYNALSHDVFNYIFNAKMVMVYHANPHLQVALDFPQDLWLRFMHNTHTPAPYGYGWTGISLIPSLLGMNKFVPTWLLFRLFSLLSLGLSWFALTELAKNKLSTYQLGLFFLNPLIILEVISNSHNDLWMLFPVILSFKLLTQTKVTKKQLLISLLLFGFSVSIKYATLILLPLWFAILLTPKLIKLLPNFAQLWNLLKTEWPMIASILLFLPLLTPRSQQFNPWYLSWVLIWLPLWWQQPASDFFTFLRDKVWTTSILVLSVSALFRYLPYLFVGEYTAAVLWQQKLITWIPFLITIFVLIFQKIVFKNKNTLRP